MSGGRGTVWQSALSFGLKIGAGLAAYAFFALLARLLSTEDFGRFSVLFSLALLLGIGGSLGQQVFLVREVPRQREKGAPAAESGVYAFSLRLVLVGAPVAAALFVLLAHWLVPGLSGATLAAGAALVALYAVSQMTFGMLRVQEATLTALFTRDLLWRLLAMPLAALLALWLAGPLVGLAALALVLVPVIAWHGVLAWRHVRGQRPGPGPRLPRDWLNASAGLGLIGVISSADFYVYTVFTGWLVSVGEAGVFFAALKTAELLNTFLMAVTLVVAPRLSALIASGAREALQRQCNLALVLQSVPLLLSVLLLLPLSQLVLSLFDPAFGAWWPLLWCLMLIMVLNALTGATVLLMQMGGMHWQQVALQGGFLLASLACLPWLAAAWGVYGVALAFGMSKLAWNLVAIVLIRRNLGVDPSVAGLARGGGLAGVLALARTTGVKGARA